MPPVMQHVGMAGHPVQENVRPGSLSVPAAAVTAATTEGVSPATAERVSSATTEGPSSPAAERVSSATTEGVNAGSAA